MFLVAWGLVGTGECGGICHGPSSQLGFMHPVSAASKRGDVSRREFGLILF